ncbi:MAG: histidine kinase dimerization/phospho-acceptor domain-containing protein [Pseudomonadota bacterium]
MTRPFNALVNRAALLCAALGLAGLATLGVLIQRSEDRMLKDISGLDMVWTVSQVEMAYERLLASLDTLSAASLVDEHARDVAMVKFEDMRWRIDDLRDIAERERLSSRLAFSYSEATEGMGALLGALTTERGAIASLAAPEEAEAVAKRLMVHRPRLHRLSIAVSLGEAARVEDVRNQLRRRREQAAAIGFGGLSLAGLLAVFAMADARRSRRLAVESAAAAKAAKAADDAKTRFLTTISHELRTPMNGVLGLVALSRRAPASPDQDALLDQAERSGRRMMDLIGDIIDFTSGAPTGPLSNAVVSTYRLGDLAETLSRKFAEPGATDPFYAASPRFAVECAARAPEVIEIDGERLRKALEHLCAYLFETAGVEDLRVTLDHSAGEVRAEISFNYLAESEGRWRPERLLGGEPAAEVDEALFASDPLGPELARGFIKALGGRMEMAALYPGRTHVTVFAPAHARPEPLSFVDFDEGGEGGDVPSVGVALASASMRMVCETVLRGAGVNIVDASAHGVILSAVLVECQDAADADATIVAGLRVSHPAARIVALGWPERPEVFDDVAATPVEVNNLRAAVIGGATTEDTKATQSWRSETR